MSSITLKNLTKDFAGDRTAVSDLSLEINDGEMFAFAGPDGCGKSTVLRLIAGLEKSTFGELYFDGALVSGASVRERDIVLVTREFPVYKKSATVADNLAFGLRQRGVDESEIAMRTRDAASLVSIDDLLDKKVTRLNKYETLKVAVCRAAVRNPKVVLIDDIFIGLDDDEKIGLMSSLIAVHGALPRTAIVCAFSFGGDAMTLCSRIAVMKDGKVRGIGTPKTLYEEPADAFVAAFLGTPQINMLPGRLIKKDGKFFVDTGSRSIAVTPARARRLIGVREGATDVLVGIRPEDIHADQRFIEASPETLLEPTVAVAERKGGESVLYMTVPGVKGYVIATVDSRIPAEVGKKITLAIDANKMRFFDKKSGRNLSAVPRLNFMPCTLFESKEGWKLSFDGGETVLPQSVVSRIADRATAAGEVMLCAPPEAFSLFGITDGLEIKGEAEFTVQDGTGNAVYVAVGDSRIVVRTGTDVEVSAGEKVKCLLPFSSVMLTKEDGTRLLSSEEITENVIEGTVIRKSGKPFAKTACGTFPLRKDPKVDNVKIRIEPKSVSTDGGDCKITGIVSDCELVAGGTIVRLKVNGFTPHFTAFLPEQTVGYQIGKKINLYCSLAVV